VGLIAALILSARLLDAQVPNFYRGPAAAAPDAIDAAAVDPARDQTVSPLDAIQAIATTAPRGGEEVSPGSTNGGAASFAPSILSRKPSPLAESTV
jgi:hypothetical protein